MDFFSRYYQLKRIRRRPWDFSALFFEMHDLQTWSNMDSIKDIVNNGEDSQLKEFENNK